MKTILLIDDSEDDVFLIKEAIKLARLQCRVISVHCGEEATTYLASISGDGSLPELIVLDLWMPGMNGHEVLKWIRAQPNLKPVPVVMLTISSMEQDKVRAYHMGVNSYLVKPRRLEDLNAMVQLLSKYWLEYNHTLIWS